MEQPVEIEVRRSRDRILDLLLRSAEPLGVLGHGGVLGQEREQRGDEYESTQSRRHGILP